jgi:hypothetical protein
MKTQKIKQMRHIASKEKVRILYLSLVPPYILREPFIYIYLINHEKLNMCCAQVIDLCTPGGHSSRWPPWPIHIDEKNARKGEPSDLEPIQLEEIVEPENPEVPSSHIRSPGGISTHLDISRTPGRKNIPNPLFDLITIYDDQESLEVSLVTQFQITEEREPDKASTVGPNASIQNLTQSDHEVESVLETELLDLLGTPIGTSRDELGLGRHKEEIPWQEIDISIDDYQVSTEPTPNSLVLVDTLSADEKKMKFDPSRHMEEVHEPILEHIHTVKSLGNTLTWGEKQIPEPVDEVTNIKVIAYDQKRKFIMKRTT